MGLAEVKEQVDKLSNEDRRQLLRDMLKTRADFDLDWMAQLERRHQEIKNGGGISREAAMARWNVAEEDLAEWGAELRRRHELMMNGQKVGEAELLRRTGLIEGR